MSSVSLSFISPFVCSFRRGDDLDDVDGVFDVVDDVVGIDDVDDDVNGEDLGGRLFCVDIS